MWADALVEVLVNEIQTAAAWFAVAGLAYPDVTTCWEAAQFAMVEEKSMYLK